MNDLSVAHFVAVATATLDSPDSTMRTLSELLLQAAHQIERHEERRRESTAMIGTLKARLDLMARRDRTRSITTQQRVDL